MDDVREAQELDIDEVVEDARALRVGGVWDAGDGDCARRTGLGGMQAQEKRSAACRWRPAGISGEGDRVRGPRKTSRLDTKSTLNTTETRALSSFTGQTTGKLPLLKQLATKTQSPSDTMSTAESK